MPWGWLNYYLPPLQSCIIFTLSGQGRLPPVRHGVSWDLRSGVCPPGGAVRPPRAGLSVRGQTPPTDLRPHPEESYGYRSNVRTQGECVCVCVWCVRVSVCMCMYMYVCLSVCLSENIFTLLYEAEVKRLKCHRLN